MVRPRRMLLKKMQGREEGQKEGWRMSRTIDVMHMEEEADQEEWELGGIRETISLLKKFSILCDMKKRWN